MPLDFTASGTNDYSDSKGYKCDSINAAMSSGPELRHDVSYSKSVNAYLSDRIQFSTKNS